MEKGNILFVQKQMFMVFSTDALVTLEYSLSTFFSLLKLKTNDCKDKRVLVVWRSNVSPLCLPV